jgi:hypothetical protein
MSNIDYGKLASKLANSTGRLTRRVVDTGVSIVRPENLKKAGDAMKGLAGSAAEGWNAAGSEDKTTDPADATADAIRKAAGTVKNKFNEFKKGFDDATSEDKTDSIDAPSDDHDSMASSK